MQIQSAGQELYAVERTDAADTHTSGVSWDAVFAGAAAAAALSLILLILGFGLGLSAVSPWSYNATAIGTSAIVWIAFTQLAASGVGGYLAGRLRVKWATVHTDEVYFRDTAHGLLTWAIATLATAAWLAGAARVVVGGAIDAGSGAANALAPAIAGSATASGTQNGAGFEGSVINPVDYFSDMLLRSDQAAPDANSAPLRNEVTKIFVANMRAGKLAPEDRDYLARIVAKRSGKTPADAGRSVDEVYANFSRASSEAQAAAKDAADKARKAAAYSALWMFVALLAGAFVASVAATFGGRQRDAVASNRA
jgi:hypothetical protein